MVREATEEKYYGEEVDRQYVISRIENCKGPA